MTDLELIGKLEHWFWNAELRERIELIRELYEHDNDLYEYVAYENNEDFYNTFNRTELVMAITHPNTDFDINLFFVLINLDGSLTTASIGGYNCLSEIYELNSLVIAKSWLKLIRKGITIKTQDYREL